VMDTDIIWSNIGYLSDNALVGYHKIFLFNHKIASKLSRLINILYEDNLKFPHKNGEVKYLLC
jgi:hypothetical protein